jgi:hypothetical protein
LLQYPVDQLAIPFHVFAIPTFNNLVVLFSISLEDEPAHSSVMITGKAGAARTHEAEATRKPESKSRNDGRDKRVVQQMKAAA